MTPLSQYGSRNFKAAYNGLTYRKSILRQAKFKYDVTLDELKMSCQLVSISKFGESN